MKNIISNLKGYWSIVSPRTKAALRTAQQTIVAGFAFMVLALLAALSTALDGGAVDLVQATSIAARAFGITVLGALSGLVSYWRNRNSGIHYR